MARLIDGTAADATPLERALITLVRKTFVDPVHLTPADLDPLRALVGDASALDFAIVIGGFHFINRIADLLHVDPEALPETLRPFETLRRLGVWMASRLMRRMDLVNREYPLSFDDALAQCGSVVEHATGQDPARLLAPLRARPKVLEIIQLSLEERDERSTLDRATLARIHRVVEAALPSTREEAEGFHARPKDPVDAFAFVGTRYAYRTTPEMIAALRTAGYDDLGILDLAIAVSDANQWARTHRLLGLTPDLFYVAEAAASPRADTARP